MNSQLATLCYVRHDKKTLMICKDKKPNSVHFGKYNGLGGKVDPGESPWECVVREVKEESGLLISSPDLVGFLTFPKFLNGIDWYVFVFQANQFNGELVESDEGSLHWVDDSEILNLNLWSGDKYFFKYLFEGVKFEGTFNYQGNELIDFKIQGLS